MPVEVEPPRQIVHASTEELHSCALNDAAKWILIFAAAGFSLWGVIGELFL